jgi:hypothetical protein
VSEEFIKFRKIERFKGVGMSITQKIHGTNAQILIKKLDSGEWLFKTGSRTRWIAPGDDNYGFAAWAYSIKEQLIECLGEGLHFGEWAGAGINSGEGLTEKTFILFDWRRHQKAILDGKFPTNVTHAPVLMYPGKYSLEKIKEVMNDLKLNGSKLSPGFMRPEGIVIEFDTGRLEKMVFNSEETAWNKPSRVKPEFKVSVDVSYLLQPVRMEKIISMDEKNIIEYPRSLPAIIKAYVADLEEEYQINTADEDEKKGQLKELGKHVFKMAKEIMEQKFISGY